MNKTRTLLELGEFYADTVINEGKSHFPAGGDKFKLQKDKKVEAAEADPKAFVPKSGPDHEGAETLLPPDEKSGERFSSDSPEFTQHTSEKKKAKNLKKVQKESINNFMTKSIFDKLYETVMSEEALPGHDDVEAQDVEALELPSGEGEVTVTLDRETAKKLHDVLMAVLGGAEIESEVESEDEGEEGEEGEDEEHYGEATELEELPDSTCDALKGKDNKVKDSWTTHNVDSSEGDGKIKGEVDAKGKVLGNKHIGSGVSAGTESTKGKSNVVHSRATKNVGKIAFTK